MRDIVFLAHRLPYPPDRGDRIRSWHVLKHLAKSARVHVCALIDDESARQHIPMVESVAASVTVARRRSNLSAIASALLGGKPASVAAFEDASLKRAVGERLARGDIAAIYAFSGQMAAYVPQTWRGRFVMDFVDMDSAKFAGLGGVANRHEGKRLLAWEIAAAKRSDASLFVSAAEAALFSAATGIAAQVVENGIDAAHFDPAYVTPVDTPHPLIVFTGQMDYRPNIDAVAAYARDTLPRTAGHFAIVGRAPTAEVCALASGRVTVTGEVADTRPWLAAADIVVAPLALARGVQNKVLEAMAMARPMVLSAAAATGIDAADGTHFVVADGAAATATAIDTLLADSARAAAMGRAARARVIGRYDWNATLAPLDGLLA